MRGSASAARAIASSWRWPEAEAAAALAEDRLVALGQALDERVGASQLRGGDHLLVGRVGPAVADVVHDRVAEQERVLQHDADLRAQAARGDVAHVDAVDRDRARRDVVEARDQVDHGRLARAGRADDGDRLARLGHQVDVAQHRLARLVLGPDVVEHDPTLRSAASVARSGASCRSGTVSSKPKMRSPPAIALWTLVHIAEICEIGWLKRCV